VAGEGHNSALQLKSSVINMIKLQLSVSDRCSINDWSRWFANSSPPPICCPGFSFMGGVAKEYITKLKLGCEKYFHRVTY
jgi:hypothetical protein